MRLSYSLRYINVIEFNITIFNSVTLLLLFRNQRYCILSFTGPGIHVLATCNIKQKFNSNDTILGVINSMTIKIII